jgi:ATP-dependent RNA helicase RhlE
LTSFTDLGLAEPILRAVTAEGYTTPTPIQAGVIPDMMAGCDIVGIAQTGTGKTAAFVLPILHKLHKLDRPEPKTCAALILAPTRELAAQIADNVRSYSQFLGLSVTVVVGGVKPRAQIRALARGVDILVATPGRLEDHISTGAITLTRTNTVVLDEADQMMDLGFMPAIRRIMKQLPKNRQTMLLSATMPKQIRALASDFLSNPSEVSVAPQSRPIELIEQKVCFVGKQAKRQLLEELVGLDEIERVIIFTRTKHGANKVVINLEKCGHVAAAIHGNKSQNQRQKTLNAFRSGELNILVATDIAARGIDIDDVSHIINYELPNIPESYVHRIGRTARAGKSGVAISLCDGTERGFLRDIEKLTGHSLEQIETPYSKTYDPSQEGKAANPRNHGRTFKKNPRRPGNKSGARGGAAPSGQKARQGQNRNRRRARA